jgi:hypothetical protein
MSIRRSEYPPSGCRLVTAAKQRRQVLDKSKYIDAESSVYMMIATLAMSLCLVSGIGNTLRLQALRIQLGASRPRP